MTHPNEDREPDAWGVEGHDGRIAAARATHDEATLVAANMAAALGRKHARPVVPLYRALPPAPAASAPADDGDWWVRQVEKATSLAALKSIAAGWPTSRPATPADDAVRAALRLLNAPYGTQEWRDAGDALARLVAPNGLKAANAALDATDAVARARERFEKSGSAWARHQFECPGAAFEGPGPDWFVENDALRIQAIHAHTALLAAERAAKGGERPRCACGCVDKLHDAGQPGTRRCNQPGCGCEDFISASRDGAAKGGERG